MWQVGASNLQGHWYPSIQMRVPFFYQFQIEQILALEKSIWRWILTKILQLKCNVSICYTGKKTKQQFKKERMAKKDKLEEKTINDGDNMKW